jgi:hypothetical protein
LRPPKQPRGSPTHPPTHPLSTHSPRSRRAAKITIKIVLQMMKRPIAHWDPALYCAHVMLWHRAPLNVSDRQTQIVLRDLMDNVRGGGVGEGVCRCHAF